MRSCSMEPKEICIYVGSVDMQQMPWGAHDADVGNTACQCHARVYIRMQLSAMLRSPYKCHGRSLHGATAHHRHEAQVCTMSHVLSRDGQEQWV